ncbi:M16 family metallopeptidase [Oenococcus oeni]|uniref:M16 family metallopeptidase n=1 Tax=Oenococcus oeni TaxID=1247 RepID=UPI0010B2E878|nr:insulinase family protein [Oenococcus oeni]MDV7686734.1 insulinase family protein [Oenococcus oeni]SYW19736.1 putative zinc-dependant protease [Oenococcus oeni]
MEKLSNGINLDLICTDQFESVKIVVDFCQSFEKESAAPRAMLARILENSSQAFSNRQLIARQLNRLYGAHFSVSTVRFGQISKIRFSLKLPNPNIADGYPLVEKGLAFLFEQIYRPLIINDLFPEVFFQTEKKNFLAEYLAAFDDKSYKLHRQALMKYFSDPNMQVSPEGDADSIKKLTNFSIVEVFKQMLLTNHVAMSVSGPIEKENIKKIIARWPILSTESVTLKDLNYRQETHNLSKVRLYERGEQSLIEDVYSLIDYNYSSEQRFLAILFSRLLGGSSQSLLFSDIREKRHLVYYVNSSIIGQDSLMVIQAGLDKNNLVEVEKEIRAQITNIKHGNFSDKLFASIKKELTTGIISSEDYQGSAVENHLNGFLSGYKVDPNDAIKIINSVTKDQVSDFSRHSIEQTKALLINEN